MSLWATLMFFGVDLVFVLLTGVLGGLGAYLSARVTPAPATEFRQE